MVKQLNSIVSWLLYTSLFAALCALSLCMATECLLLHALPPLLTPLHGYIMGCTLVVYNTHFLIRKAAFSSSNALHKHDWSVRNRPWHVAAASAGVLLAIVSLFYLSLDMIVASLVMGLLSFMYTLPLLPFGRRLRDWGLVKILTLTSVWTITTSVLPMLYWQYPVADYPMEIAMRFVLMFSLCVAFDIRDMHADTLNRISTLPNLIGISRSKKLINAALILFLLLAIIQWQRYGIANRLAAELLTVFAAGIVLNKAGGDKKDTFYLGLVDGLMLLNGVLVMLLSPASIF